MVTTGHHLADDKGKADWLICGFKAIQITVILPSGLRYLFSLLLLYGPANLLPVLIEVVLKLGLNL